MAFNGKKLVIGVDGGGTKTSGILMTESGEILAEGSWGSSNPHSNPEEKVREALHGLVGTLCSNANVPVIAVDGVGMGMAGCDRPADKAFIEKIVREKIGETPKLVIVNDAIVAMVAVLKRLHGILVIAGTGSICYGYNGETGTSARSGGWGHLLADEGSGYALGLGALKAVLAELDGRGPATTLTQRVLTTLGLQGPTDLVGWTYMSGKGKTDFAALSILVHEEEAKGDAAARQLLDEAAASLVSLIPPLYRKLFMPTTQEVIPVALWGGNLLNARAFQARFIERLKATGLNVTPVVKDEQAVVGAAQHMLNNL